MKQTLSGRHFGKTAITLVYLLLLAGCGFSLRGSERLLAGFPTLALNLQQPGSEFSVLLERRLESAGIITVPSTEATMQDLPVLSVAAEQLASRPVTVNPSARAAQYELQLSLTIGINGPQSVIMEPELLTVERLFFENIETISGNLEEMQVIQTEMRRELADQVMRRLEAASSNNRGT